MKKNKKIFRILVAVLSVLVIFGVVMLILEINSTKLTQEDKEMYSKLVGGEWTRNDGADREILYFSEQDAFGYYYSSGSPIDNFDLYDKYVLKRNGKIQLKGVIFGLPIRGSMKVISVSEDKLEMKINGKIREFVRVKDGSKG